MEAVSLATDVLDGLPPTKSRAVLRNIEPGNQVICLHCGEWVKFQAKHRVNQVICNVYVRKIWNRVEHYHASCYTQAGEPYGTADAGQLRRRKF